MCILIVALTFSDNVAERKPPSAKEIADTALGVVGIIIFFAFLTSGRGCASYSPEDNCEQSLHGVICQ